MTYLKVKSGYLDVNGLKLEEHDVDKEEICSQRLNQLMSVEDLDDLSLSQATVGSRKSHSSIPSSKATRLCMLSRSWNFPRIEFYSRQLCRSADFYETRFRKPTRYASEPDLPRAARSEEMRLPLILTFSKENSDKLREDFFIQGRNILPSLEMKQDDNLNNNSDRFAPRRSPTSTIKPISVHATEKALPRGNNRVKVTQGEEERNTFKKDFPLITRQCFPTPETQTNCDKNNTENKIQPMERKRDSKFNKYVQSRFGRSLELSIKEPIKSWKHSSSVMDWEGHQNMVEKILGHPGKNHGNDHVTNDKRLADFLSCSSVDLIPGTSNVMPKDMHSGNDTGFTFLQIHEKA